MVAEYALAPTDLDTRTRIKRALDLLNSRRMVYELPGAYYEGRQRLTFATQSFRNVFGGLFKEFADNLCRPTCDAVVDRLEITGFENETAGDAENQQLDNAWRIWQDNRMDLGSIEVHLDTVLYGDGYVVVWPDDTGKPEIYPQAPWEMVCGYDPERRDRVAWAAKSWMQDDNYCRLTLYYPDRIEKYITRGTVSEGGTLEASAFVPYAELGEPWPLPNPYDKVPVFHFSNSVKRGHCGTSELADVIPLQDLLNKQVADMVVASEFVAFPQRYAIGVMAEINADTGKPRVSFKPGPGNLWTVEDTDVQFGQFDAGDITQYVTAINDTRVEVARVSRTPLHYLVPMAGTPPSGEALKTAEAPFLGKVKRKQIVLGNTWEDVMRFAMQIVGEPTANLNLSALWKDPESRNEFDDLQAMDIKVNKVGISKEQALRELGYSERQIEQMQADAQAAEQRAMDTMKRQQDMAMADTFGQDGRPTQQ